MQTSVRWLLALAELARAVRDMTEDPDRTTRAIKLITILAVAVLMIILVARFPFDRLDPLGG